MPGRVVWAHEPQAVKWDGSGYWWETEHFDEKVIRSMVNQSVATLANQATAKDGWNALFTAHNRSRGKNGGYAAGEKIAIKANINGSAVNGNDTSGETQMSYTNPVLLKTLLVSLVEEGGVAPSDITVYDVSRLFPDYMVEMCTEGFLPVSYTHLDVYKRQILILMLANTSGYPMTGILKTTGRATNT